MACRTGRGTLLRLAAAGFSLLALVGCWASEAAPGSGELRLEPRVIRIVASNFGYEPSRIEVHRGELVRFVFENPTDLPHEIFIGSEAAQAEREATLAAGVDPSEPDPAALYVPAGGVAQLEYLFGDPTQTIIGCHLAGHWESGMRAEIAIR